MATWCILPCSRTIGPHGGRIGGGKQALLEPRKAIWMTPMSPILRRQSPPGSQNHPSSSLSPRPMIPCRLRDANDGAGGSSGRISPSPASTPSPCARHARVTVVRPKERPSGSSGKQAPAQLAFVAGHQRPGNKISFLWPPFAAAAAAASARERAEEDDDAAGGRAPPRRHASTGRAATLVGPPPRRQQPASQPMGWDRKAPQPLKGP